jgi:hypothetical protein
MLNRLIRVGHMYARLPVCHAILSKDILFTTFLIDIRHVVQIQYFVHTIISNQT